MAVDDKIYTEPTPVASLSSGDEKKEKDFEATAHADEVVEEVMEGDLRVTNQDLGDAEEYAKGMTLEETIQILQEVLKLHKDDPNFPDSVINRVEEFLFDEDVMANPENHAALVWEMKIEAALITTNSPYAEVRAVVDNVDDPNTPVGTIRAWIIGLIFVAIGAFINQFFSFRQPSISVTSACAQLLAYPCGKAMATFLPDWGFTLFGERISLNPGPFNKKEHMLITIMANVGFDTPYTNDVIVVQFLPKYFNQSYAAQFSYQFCIGMSTNFLGYSIAGLTRKFLVYPAYCVWPTSLVTIALNRSFHHDANVPVLGPFNRMYRSSRLKCFTICFCLMFVYFWFPDFIFEALSYFNWMTWIAPDNVNLALITGGLGGLGLNPIPTFDWNVFGVFCEPLVVPIYNVLNMFGGMVLAMFCIIGLYWNNTYYTGYLPLNSNYVFDNTGSEYNISLILNDEGLYDQEKYEAYSPAYMAAGNITVYIFFFAVYSATVSYAWLYHRHEIWLGLKNSFKRKNDSPYKDVHNRLMAAYKEVPEWWYLITAVIAIGFGCGGIAGFETYTSVGVIFFGLAMCLVFVIPIGIIYAITGMSVTLNVLAEFIGGAWAPGNALSMMFFKSFGYVTCAQTLYFAQDLKLAHYTHIPPRTTFWAQMIGTLVSTFVCVGILNFQMGIPNVCTAEAEFDMTCPGINTFFTAAAVFGTLGPKKMFGTDGIYKLWLIAFPVGFVIPIIFYYARKKFPRASWLRQLHPVIILYGGLNWAPYNLMYVWPAVPVAVFSMYYLKRNYLAFWSKYNYVVSAAFSTAIAICAVVIFFAVDWAGVDLDWWGNDVSFEGCDYVQYGASDYWDCGAYAMPDSGTFGPVVGEFS